MSEELISIKIDPHKKLKLPSECFGTHLTRSLYNNLDLYRTAFVNHGSYGVAPTMLLRKHAELLRIQDESPDKFFRYESFDLWKHNISSLANYLNVDAKSLLLCQNVTDALNAVIKSINMNQDNIHEEVILACQYTYKAVANTLDFYSKYRLDASQKVKVYQVPCVYPLASEQQIVDAFDKQCEQLVNEKKCRIVLAVVDHITSETATVFPVKRIVETIKKWSSKTPVIVDGAHALGQIDIDLNDLGCDFYASNLHKWFLAPRSCAFLYIRDVNWAQRHLQPNVISNLYNRELSENFHYRGSANTASFYLVDDCIRMHRDFLGGRENIVKYVSKLLDEAVEMLVTAWKTQELEMAKEMRAPFMRMIKLPKLKSIEVKENSDDNEAMCLALVKKLYDEYSVDTFITVVQNTLYCRVSCFIYNELCDYESLKNAILALKDD